MASGPHVGGNLQEAGRLIELAAATGARIIALPEYFAIMGMKDTDKVAARVKELGGEADAPRPVQGRGWFSTCRDTQGNEFGLWQNDPSAPTPAA